MQNNPVYLVMVTAENNHNKFYKMIPNGNGFDVEFGRVGVGGFQTAHYDSYQWEKKYREKTAKGYQDQTHLMMDLVVKDTTKSKTSSEYSAISNATIALIVQRLQQMAKQAIEENYTISSNKVTSAMVAEAQMLLNQLAFDPMRDIGDFNCILLKLFATIPRKMGKVADYIPKGSNDYSRIIQAEQDLLDVMKGQVVQKQAEDDEEVVDGTEQKSSSILDAMGLVFEEVNGDDIRKITNLLGDCSSKFHQAWRVQNIRTQDKFNTFIKENAYGGQSDNIMFETRLLWHGSRNENFWSILNTGLVLRPTNAVITGKMFGYGLYLSNLARKSLGYTSINGSYWANGNANSGFMILYDTAYGKPLDAYDFDSKYYNFNWDALQKAKQGSHCLHAHSGAGIRNDEIIVYKEEQITIQYLVELK